MSLFELRGISKRYPGVQALDAVDLDVEGGEVHSLLGQNGAGKSTLMKIIAGAEQPDTGTMRLEDEPVPFGDPSVAHTRGIGIVYQELSLVPTMSVGENILLGRWARRHGMVDLEATDHQVRPLLERVGLNVDPSVRVNRLGVAERQLVEMAKALSTDARVLLLDEPTSALSGRESRRLFAVIRDLTTRGVAVVYVSHRLPEVLKVSHRISVLRDGRHVGGLDTKDADEHELARLMVGRELTTGRSGRHRVEDADAGVALRARGLGRPPRLKPLDLDLRAGEVATVFGLVGAGRSRLARTLFGIEPATTGELELFGRRIRINSPAVAIAGGIGYVGEDRAAGLVPQISVAQNITLASLPQISSGLTVDRGQESDLGQRYVDGLKIDTPSVHRRVATLSGGNQQKVLLARSLCSGARVLVLDDPVRGVDVGAKEEVFRLVRDLSAEGTAILYLTSDLREARELGDRVLVMANGRIVSELPPTITDDELMAAAGGANV